MNRTKNRLTGREFAAAMMLVVALGVVLTPVLAAVYETELRTSCGENLRQLGVTLRMYADEDAGGFYPPMTMYTTPEFGGGTTQVRDCSAVGAAVVFPVVPDTISHLEHIVRSPNVDTIYPEYVTDFSLFVCPADVGWTTNDLYNPGTGEIDLMHYCSGDSYRYKRGSRLLDYSYLYFGWVFDKTGDDPEWLVRADQTFFNPAANGWPADTMLSAQKCAWTMEIAGASFTPPDAFDVQSRSDLIVSFPTISLCGGSGALPGGFGNGASGNVLFRLKKGVERLLTTDVNNAGKAALEASGIFVMHDRVSTVVDEFNHLPDGGNVLYLDGHVDFIRYPGKSPIGKADAIWSSLLPRSTPTPGQPPAP